MHYLNEPYIISHPVYKSVNGELCYFCCRTPEQCPSVVSLLAESYNPHVRYGAAMALGIACAGTGLKEAIALLDPMTNDSVNFVRQGALIASAMILIQQTEATCARVKDFRALYAKVVVDKHEDVMAKFGAILAQGIIDAGELTFETTFILFRCRHLRSRMFVQIQIFMLAIREMKREQRFVLRIKYYSEHYNISSFLNLPQAQSYPRST